MAALKIEPIDIFGYILLSSRITEGLLKYVNTRELEAELIPFLEYFMEKISTNFDKKNILAPVEAMVSEVLTELKWVPFVKSDPETLENYRQKCRKDLLRDMHYSLLCLRGNHSFTTAEEMALVSNVMSFCELFATEGFKKMDPVMFGGTS